MRAWLIIPFIAFWLGIHVFKNAWSCLAIYHGLILLPLLIHRQQWDLKNLFRGFRWKWFLFHLAGCCALFYALSRLATINNFGANQLNGVVSFGGTGIGFAIYFVLVNPIFEEVFWRDCLSSPGKGLSLSDIGFGCFHAVILWPFLSPPYIAAFVIGLIIIGWVWRQIRYQTNGLAIPWIGHALGDAMFVAIVWYLMVKN